VPRWGWLPLGQRRQCSYHCHAVSSGLAAPGLWGLTVRPRCTLLLHSAGRAGVETLRGSTSVQRHVLLLVRSIGRWRFLRAM
jgi:hypothetical protein